MSPSRALRSGDQVLNWSLQQMNLFSERQENAVAAGFGGHILQGVQAGGRSVETQGLEMNSDVIYHGHVSLQGR